MIFAYSVLSGYQSVRGSFAVHMPMFIAMLIFVNPYTKNQLPDEEDFEWTWPGARLWTYYGLWMHLLLAFLHFVMMTAAVPEGAQVFRLVLQIIGVVAQVLNLCIICTLYTQSPAMELMNDKQIAFEGWVFTESYMIAFITIANSIFLF